MKPPDIIDFRDEIAAIRNRYSPRADLSEGALKEAAALWGGSPNAHGVLPAREETLAVHGRCKAIVRLACTSKGYWLMGVCVSTAVSGLGYSPSVWDRVGYGSCHDARLAGILKMEDWFNRHLSGGNSCISEKTRVEIRHILETLSAEKTPQLDLFG
jgi:hypothetical protein